MASLTLVVPCYNEADRLDAERFLGFLAPGHDVRFLFVNDGSRDDTLARLETLRERAPSTIQVLDLETNCGKAEAVRRGLLAGLDEGADLVGFWDADLSTPLDELPPFLDVLGRRPEIQMVFGSRVKLLGRQIVRRAWRHYLGRVFATLVSTMLGLPVYDTQCGAKIFRASTALRNVLAEPFVSRWLFDVEILARWIGTAGSHATAASIYELPLTRWRDVPGSSLTPRAYARAATTLLAVWLTYRRTIRSPEV